jgi:putative transposase
MDNKTLVKTLDFQLDIQSDNAGLLYEATLEARQVYNETIRLARKAWIGARFPLVSKTTPTL